MDLIQKGSSVGIQNKEERFNVTQKKAPAALSQVDYLQKQLNQLESLIDELENKQKVTGDELRDLYFKKGKLFSDLELMKRVPSY